MTSSDSEEECHGILTLTQEENSILPWQQLLTNGSIDPRCVRISNSPTNFRSQDFGNLEEYFSDGELSEDEEEHEVHATRLELRDYQYELSETAVLGNNTIICAPTGSGKTRVATYIIAEHLKVSDGREKKVAFLARTVPLAIQQYKSLCKYLPKYKITHITGESESNMSLHLLLPYHDIVVMTPMILENHLTRKFLPHLGVFSMLIFDECHHTRKGEPYNTLMSSYLKKKQEISEATRIGKLLNFRLPQIVGLTASIGIERADNFPEARKNILKVCGNLDASKISVVERYKTELSRIVPIPTELSRRLDERRDNVAVQKIIEIMRNLEMHMVKHIRELNRDDLKKMAVSRPENRKSQEYEQWAVLTMNTAKTVPLSTTDDSRDLSVRLIVIIALYLQRYRFALETYDLVELRDVMDYLDKCFQDLQAHEYRTSEENVFYEYFVGLKNFVLQGPESRNSNLMILTETLTEYILSKGNESRGIIFVRTRALAEALASWLNRCENQEIRNLNACIFTGSNTPEEKGGTSQPKQESIIQRFRSGEVRLLVATSVAEEGIDIPECNLVVKYNHVGNEVSVIQTRGRSRAFGGVSVLLAMDNVLERELVNKGRAELMWRAIESVKDMKPDEFQAAVEEHQQELLEAAELAEAAERAKKKDLLRVPFKIICPWCRKVSIENTKMRTIYGKYRVSVDRNLLDKISLHPYPELVPFDGLFLVGQVFCKGEIKPGKHCYHQLGVIIKHKGIPMVSVGINNIAFQLDTQAELLTYKKWKKVHFTINELNYDDIKRYVTETYILRKQPISSGGGAEAEDDSTDDEEDSD